MKLIFNTITLFIILGMSNLCLAQGIQMGKSTANKQQAAPITTEEYTIAGIKVGGAEYFDEDLIISITGLSVGDVVKLPNDDKFAKAIQNLWKQNMFSDIAINQIRSQDKKVFLEIYTKERPRLSKYTFKGAKDNEAKDLKDKVGLVKSKVVTEATKENAVQRIKKYYTEKGYVNAFVKVTEKPDTSLINAIILTFIVNKGQKVKINEVFINGNENASSLKLKRTMKGCKEMARISLHSNKDEKVGEGEDYSFKSYLKNKGFLSLSKTATYLDPYFRYKIFSASKFNRKKLEDDKEGLVSYYNSIGYRDASIAKDSVYLAKNGHLNVEVTVKEGNKYYFGDFDWKGNTKYTVEQLNTLLGIKKGDVYNQELLDKRLGKIPSMEGDDVSSLYLDDGYLAFNSDASEKSVNGDTINFEIRMNEGDQYTIRNINIFGNDKTHEHVIRRELRTLPGNRFSRSDIIRSQREISNLGFFDAEKIGIIPRPHNDGTVDIDYTVTEKSADQLELQAGFGGGLGITGTLGVAFNNFALKNIKKRSAWDPLPMGDGQKIALRGQANGKQYNSITFSFTEPWLGGKKPTSLSFNLYRTHFSNGNQFVTSTGNMNTIGAGISLSKRLRWPDDNFVISYGLNYQMYRLNNYANFFGADFANGVANNLSFKTTLSRYSIDQPLYPRSGSNIMLSAQITPPFSSFNNVDYDRGTTAEKYKWIEYHKVRFTAEWYQRLKGNMVLKLAVKHGYLGYYNPKARSPFERFQVGGDGMAGFTVYGRDIIAHRGYEIYSTEETGDVAFNKYTAEVRYPFSLNPSSTIYGHAFYEMGNSWSNIKNFNPLKLNRSAGVGIRIFLPMFGLLGLDYGIRFDDAPNNLGLSPSNPKLGGAAKIAFMLGQEPE
jgi:outer membrane protein insertion porin family